MSKHTPAPWYIDGTVRGTDLIVSNDDYQVAICITHPNPDSNKANARLIAAAPELLEALRIARNYVEAVYLNTPNPKKARNYSQCLDIIDGAINNATGE